MICKSFEKLSSYLNLKERKKKKNMQLLIRFIYIRKKQQQQQQQQEQQSGRCWSCQSVMINVEQRPYTAIVFPHHRH